MLAGGEPTPETLSAAIRKFYGDKAEPVLKAYAATTTDEVFEAAMHLASARFISYGTWKWTELHMQTSGKPVYRYLYARVCPAYLGMPGQPPPVPPVSGLASGQRLRYSTCKTMLNPRRPVHRLGIAIGIAMLTILTVSAQRGRFRFNVPSPGATVPYDGRFTVVRLWYQDYPGWSFDYPDMERNFTLILKDLTSVPARPDGSNILRMDDPELMKYPIAYLSEPGYWYPTDAETEGLRTYLAKGGFLIVDDFHFENEWRVFEAAVRKVLPGARIERLTSAHPVFNSFFSIESLEVPYPGRLGERGLMGEFYGIYEDNDTSKRLAVVINYNMDIGDYMEHSASGFYAVDPTNEAFKFGVNYVVYGLTH